MATPTEKLRKIATLDSLVEYLRDDMGWPIEADDFDDIVFEYTPEELGIDDASAAKIESIKRMRPLTTSQPWGVFFIEFEPRKLPVGALRRILNEVVVKKRATSDQANMTPSFPLGATVRCLKSSTDYTGSILAPDPRCSRPGRRTSRARGRPWG